MTSRTQCPDWVNHKQKSETGYKSNLHKVNVSLSNRATRGESLTIASVCKCHKQINLKFLPKKCPDYYAGNFRQKNIEMPCLDQDVSIKGIRGFEPRSVYPAMKKLVDEYENNCAKIRELNEHPEKIEKIAFSTAILIGKIIRVHPFLNGNGTISRVLMHFAFSRFNFRCDFRLVPRPDGDYSVLMEHCMNEDYRPLAEYLLKTISKRATS